MCNLSETKDTVAEYDLLKALIPKVRKSVTAHLVFDNPMFMNQKTIPSLSGTALQGELTSVIVCRDPPRCLNHCAPVCFLSVKNME